MAFEMAGNLGANQIPNDIVEFSDQVTSFTDLVFGFFEEGQNSSETSSDNSFNSYSYNNDEEEDGEGDEKPYNVEENQVFWKEQEQVLQVNFHT